MAEFAFAALPPMLVAHGDTSSEKSIMDALTALLPFSPRDVQDKKRSLDRWLHW